MKILNRKENLRCVELCSILGKALFFFNSRKHLPSPIVLHYQKNLFPSLKCKLDVD